METLRGRKGVSGEPFRVATETWQFTKEAREDDRPDGEGDAGEPSFLILREDSRNYPIRHFIRSGGRAIGAKPAETSHRAVKPKPEAPQQQRSLSVSNNGRNIPFRVTTQNCIEFWNVSTRPANKNGFGLTAIEADRLLTLIVAVDARTGPRSPQT